MNSRPALRITGLANATATLLAECSGDSTKSEDTVTVAGDVPLAYLKRST